MERILVVDLQNRTQEVRELPPEVQRAVLGGRGLGAYLLYTMAPPGIGPQDPANPLIFAAGPFAGTPWPSAVQFQVTAKSPLTQAYGGGFAWGDLAPRLRRAGFAAVVFVGRASSPVYAVLTSGGVTIHDAQTLWGKDTRETTSRLQESYPEASVATIGPAGERLAGLASIIADKYHMVIRTGLGAVMGGKHLKALVVTETDPAPPADIPRKFAEFAGAMYQQVADHPASRRLRELGKPMLIDSKNQVGDLPTKNHQFTSFDQVAKINAEAVKGVTKGNRACPGCPIGCIRETETATTKTEGPEYEPIWALGPRIGVGDLGFLIELYERCLSLGLDPIGLGGVLAFAMEGVERGLIQASYRLAWGQPDGITSFVTELVEGTGLGGELRDGTRAYAARQPATRRFAIEVKGVELSGQEPRQSKAFGLSLAVSNWGADWGYGLPTLDVAHNVKAASVLFPDYLPEILEVTSEKHKARLVKFTEEFNAVSDSLGICKFACPETYALMPADLARGLELYMSSPLTPEELLSIGERTVNLERMYNLREGLTAADDYLPERFLKEPITVDVYSGDRLTGLVKTDQRRTLVSRLGPMKEEYYALRGWPGGMPDAAKLESLGLRDLLGGRWGG